MAKSRGDRGAVSIEYVGVGAAVIVIVGALLLSGVGAKVGDSFAYVFCKAASVVDGRACSMGTSDDGTSPGDLSGFSPRERAEAGDYVAIGDSYISGEGAAPYIEGTNVDYAAEAERKRLDDMNPFERVAERLKLKDEPEEDANYCHRSDNSWAPKVYANGDFKGEFTFAACSGATTKQYWEQNSSSNGTEDPQQDAIDEDTTLVTLSMGGNDAKFSKIVENCVNPFGDGCGSDKTDGVKADIDKAAEELVKVYQDMRKRAHPGARILIAGYPQLFPDEDDDASGSDSGVSRDEQRWLNEMGDYANQKIREATERSGTGVEFVDVSDALEGHEIGTDDPWLNDLDVGFGGADKTGASVESFHPKAEGHNAILAIVNDQIDRGP